MSSKFTSAGLVEEIVWNSRMADLPRGAARAQIERIAYGHPPYTRKEAEEFQIDTNVNFLFMPESLADGRRSYYNAFLKQGKFFTVTLDTGTRHKRKDRGAAITREISRMMQRSRPFYKLILDQGRLVVLHGIAPAPWRDQDHWCPKMVGIEDVLIPSDTDSDFSNLPYFAVFRQYTAAQLWKATHCDKVDPGWNMDLVNAALEWAGKQWWKERSYADLYSPQKVEALYKEDLGYMGSDAVPTIDAWDFYYWDDADKVQGWRRKVILDTPPAASISGRTWKHKPTAKIPKENIIGSNHGQFLYDGGNYLYASQIDEIIHFQMADCAVSGKYHEIRGLGWFLFGPCHLANRLMGRQMDAAFEDANQFFKVSNPADHERVLKVQLANKGIVPEGVQFVTKNERWAVNPALQESAMAKLQQRIQAGSAQYREGRESDTGTKEKTATQIMAEVNAANALVSSMYMQAYKGNTFLYTEICRRVSRKNSSDPEVNACRTRILEAGVPEEILNYSGCWNIEPERVMGGGNKILEVAMADKLMSVYHLLEPESQREVLHDFITVNSEDPDKANRLVPVDKRKVSDSAHDALLLIGPMMDGVANRPAPGQNPQEMAGELLQHMGVIIERITKGLTVLDKRDVVGLTTISAAVKGYLQILSGDKESKGLIKGMAEKLKEYDATIGEMLKAVTQQPQPQQGGNGADPKDAAKAQSMVIQAKTKAQLAAQSHAQRTRERDVAFRMKQTQQNEAHREKLRMESESHALDVAQRATDMAAEAEASTAKNRLKSLQE